VLCARGWGGRRAPAARGGAGLGMQEYCALAEEFGQALVPEPLISAAIAARCLSGDRAPAVISGTQIVLPAWQERSGLPDDGPLRTVFDGRKLTGEKHFVTSARGADAFLVTTASGLAFVEASAPGLTQHVVETQDGGHFANIRFEDVDATPIADASFDDALSDATLASAAYLVGAASRAFEITLDYMKIRRQFGKLIGTFQALQHRAVDLYLQLALMRASVESAAAAVDAGIPKAQAQAAISRAKARASHGAMLICRQAIQLHGGIGYTDEADIGLFLRKAMTILNHYGSELAHRARYFALIQATAFEPDSAA
jgi:alkylation response protein AidB-like acyl-CoA dehydrogenase